MARSISGTLDTAQQAASRVPYIYLLFTSSDGGTTHNYSVDQKGRRILSVDHREEAYNDYAVIVLRNNDRTVPDLTGYWTEIGYGDYSSGGGNEYELTPRLWVKNQQTVSAGGQLYDILELEGMWAQLREELYRVGTPPYYIQTTEDGDFGSSPTAFDIMGLIMTEIGFTLNALVEDDGIINTYTPTFSVNDTRPFEYGAGILYRLIKMTKSYLKPLKSLEFEIKYPQASDAVDLTYYSDAAYYFYKYIERLKLLIPNHIIAYGNVGSDGLWTDYITGEALDQTQIDKYKDVTDLEIAPEVTTQTDIDNRASALLTRFGSEVLGGFMVAPHDCRLELYDRIAIQDNR